MALALALAPRPFLQRSFHYICDPPARTQRFQVFSILDWTWRAAPLRVPLQIAGYCIVRAILVAGQSACSFVGDYAGARGVEVFHAAKFLWCGRPAATGVERAGKHQSAYRYLVCIPARYRDSGSMLWQSAEYPYLARSAAARGAAAAAGSH